jgi:hypothetical protein
MPLPRRVAKPRRQEEVWAGAVPLVGAAERPRQLRARPSGLKGRCRYDGRWPTLDPGVSTVPDPAAAPGSCTPLPAQRAAQTRNKIKSLQPSLYGFRGLA